MKKDTKKRIQEAAVNLFNRHGYTNVRLQQIAAEAQMSAGNMAYHYKNKLELLLAVCDHLQRKREELLNEIQLTPVFENFDYFLQETFQLQQAYSFFYQDTLELVRASPELAEQFQQHLQWQQVQFEILLNLYRASGFLTWQEPAVKVESVAAQVRHTIHGWRTRRLIDGHSSCDFGIFRNDIWAVLKPFMTETGWNEFEIQQQTIGTTL